MNGTRATDVNYKAQLAHDFNKFYLDITGSKVKQVGNYKLLEEIGEGSFGKVYLATHVLLNVQVVLKCGLLDDPNIVREIYYQKQLKHKNIVKLYEVIRTESHLWIVMEFCQGNELYYHIYEKRRLDYKEVQSLFHQIILGLKYVHSLNLVHRDLKLENILLADKKKTIIKLSDFGFIREYNPLKRNFLSTVCGTTVYMAPEMLKGEKYNGVSTDIWALGVILYTMFFSQMPFDEDDDLKTKFKIIHEEPTYYDGIPAHAVKLVKSLLSKDPMTRPTITEILSSEFLCHMGSDEPEKLRKSSSMAETESIMSINQHYNLGIPPFQSKVAKHLLNRFKKLNMKVKDLEDSINNSEVNSLTAFYELALTKEYNLKKKKKALKDRRRKARSSLRKSKNRVKSALSLTDANNNYSGSQPLERIFSSLSMSSKTQSKTNLAAMGRKSSETSRFRAEKADITVDTEISSPPYNRSVSFHPQDLERRPSNVTAVSSHYDKKSKRIMNKLQFWKKNKEEDILPVYPQHYKLDEVREHTLQRDSPSPKTLDDSLANGIVKVQIPEDDKSSIKDEHSSGPIELILNDSPTTTNISNSELSGLKMRTRPSSVISQISQMSHLSQMSTMMSESELDILDESDSMDDYEEDGMYESSINTSQHEFSHRSSLGNSAASYSQITKAITNKKRPKYHRQPSSDISVNSSTTSRQPSHKKKSSLTHVSSNSSEESDRFGSTQTQPSVDLKVPSPLNKMRARSPVAISPRTASPKITTTDSYFSIPGRPSSPPISSKLKNGTHQIEQALNKPETKRQMYQPKLTTNEEEEGEEEPEQTA